MVPMTSEATVGHDSTLAATLLVDPRFPRCARYDPIWQYDNAMGPNPLWLAEELSQHMDLQPGMRILDLGCGMAASSIFLAREFDVDVVAADLWIDPGPNWERIREAGVADRVMPIHAEAHNLKFAPEYFDAIVSLDAYHYFGTCDLYLGYIVKYLRPGGRLGIVVPAVNNELDGFVPEHLTADWDWDFASFHSADWWRRHWSKTGKVEVEYAAPLPDGWRHWLRWEQYGAVAADERWRDQCARWARNLETDAGRHLGFATVVAAKPAEDR